jgi:hypothetical protein
MLNVLNSHRHAAYHRNDSCVGWHYIQIFREILTSIIEMEKKNWKFCLWIFQRMETMQKKPKYEVRVKV